MSCVLPRGCAVGVLELLLCLHCSLWDRLRGQAAPIPWLLPLLPPTSTSVLGTGRAQLAPWPETRVCAVRHWPMHSLTLIHHVCLACVQLSILAQVLPWAVPAPSTEGPGGPCQLPSGICLPRGLCPGAGAGDSMVKGSRCLGSHLPPGVSPVTANFCSPHSPAWPLNLSSRDPFHPASSARARLPHG